MKQAILVQVNLSGTTENTISTRLHLHETNTMFKNQMFYPSHDLLPINGSVKPHENAKLLKPSRHFVVHCFVFYSGANSVSLRQLRKAKLL